MARIKLPKMVRMLMGRYSHSLCHRTIRGHPLSGEGEGVRVGVGVGSIVGSGVGSVVGSGVGLGSGVGDGSMVGSGEGSGVGVGVELVEAIIISAWLSVQVALVPASVYLPILKP